MKHTLRCHDFGWGHAADAQSCRFMQGRLSVPGQNRASPNGVAASIASSFVAKLANTASIGFTSLRAIDNSDSQRTRVSSC
jgi:hypothetical protein